MAKTMLSFVSVSTTFLVRAVLTRVHELVRHAVWRPRARLEHVWRGQERRDRVLLVEHLRSTIIGGWQICTKAWK